MATKPDWVLNGKIKMRTNITPAGRDNIRNLLIYSDNHWLVETRKMEVLRCKLK